MGINNEVKFMELTTYQKTTIEEYKRMLKQKTVLKTLIEKESKAHSKEIKRIKPLLEEIQKKSKEMSKRIDKYYNEKIGDEYRMRDLERTLKSYDICISDYVETEDIVDEGDWDKEFE